MTTTKTTMSDEVHVGLPLDEPAAEPGCGVCAALDRQRAGAAETGNFSRVSDCNVEIRNHSTGHRGRQ
ncbi:hypothetical protein [Streptomyces sp. NPDC058254]|uniref:hypothetical protein n=1 Tax=Streptomyces sp. NPDC058254 TaxID=3346406 RepID=UPI0036E2E03A